MDARELLKNRGDFFNVMAHRNRIEFKGSSIGFEDVERLASNVAGSPEQCNDVSYLSKEVPSVGDENQDHRGKHTGEHVAADPVDDSAVPLRIEP
jgi:hypothetical protein